MPWSPNDSLVIGISARALFDLDAEDRIFQLQKTAAYIAYQRGHEQELMKPGVAFGLVRALLRLNKRLGTPGKPAIDIVIISKNHPDCVIRIKRSLEHYQLPIRRAILTGGQDVLPYLRSLEVDLFLSKEAEAVESALRAGFSAGLIYGGPAEPRLDENTPSLAFDCDAVLVSDEADRIFEANKPDLTAFAAFEKENLDTPLQPGPLYRFARALAELQDEASIDSPPFRVALVTSRDITYCERPIKTMRAWGLRIDQGFFVSDMYKRFVLAALKPLIFFDDSKKHLADACPTTNSVEVPVLAIPETGAQPPAPSDVRGRREAFTAICRMVLKKDYSTHEPALIEWCDEHLLTAEDPVFASFIAGFSRSAEGTPVGKHRPPGEKPEHRSFVESSSSWKTSAANMACPKGRTHVWTSGPENGSGRSQHY